MRRHGERALWSRIVGLSLRWPGQQRLNMADGRRPRRPPERQRRGELQAGMQQLEQRLALAADARVTSLGLPPAGTYKAGDELRFVVNFDKPVSVVGTPRIDLTIGSADRPAEYVRGNGTRALQFRHVVAAGDLDTDGIAVARTIVLPAGAAIRDAASGHGASVVLSPGQRPVPQVKVDGVGPSVTAFGLPAVVTAGPWGAKAASVRVTFGEPVRVTGRPTMPFLLGGAARQMTYAGGSGTNVLTFTYQAARGESLTAANVTLPEAARVVAAGGVAITDLPGNRPVSLARPAGVSLTATTIPENAPAGTLVGTLATVDRDQRDQFRYSLVAGAGATGNSSFRINGSRLESATPFDFETRSSYSIRVRATDSGGLSTERQFTIGVTDVQERPPLFSGTLVTLGLARVSTSDSGVHGDGDSFVPVFSPDGAKVAFTSRASNLVPGDTNGEMDVFMRDLKTGTIVRVSVDADGNQGNGFSHTPFFSADGSKVGFLSYSQNLVPGDTNGSSDIFVKDLATGAVTRVDLDRDGRPAMPTQPAFDPSGTRIVFSSYGELTALPDDWNGASDVFVKDLLTGAITRISSNAAGGAANGNSWAGVFSADGLRLSFVSDASDLVPGDTNGSRDVFVKDLLSGVITRVSTDASGIQGNGFSAGMNFSPDGTWLAFSSHATNLVPDDTNNASDVFVKNLVTGAINRVSTDAAGQQATGYSVDSVFSPDGGKVAFLSSGSNLVPGARNDTHNIFVKDLATGGITQISRAPAGPEPNASSSEPVFSPDGTWLAFTSAASNLLPGETNGGLDVFIASLGFAASVPERTATVGTFGATDPDPGTTLAYSIGGVDAARFTIDPATGAVRFASPPSAATPADANADNVYEILVSVTDGVFTTTVPAQVSVTPVAPVDAFMEFVSIGDVGNAADVGGYGAVGYAYRMGKYEVTIGQYAAFLNAVAKTDTYGLWNPAMGTDLNVAGISRSGSPGSYAYTVMDNGGPSGNRPITYASWFDAARFANWMHNGRPIGAQGAGTTETGAYTLNGATSGTAPARNVGARFALPTEDEWYKAAYYKGGSTSAGYWFGAMTSNSSPGNSISTGLNQANSFNGTYTVTQSYVYSPGQNYLTDVGSFSNSASAYGTFDQSGNAFEWNDLTGAAGLSRGLRGGYWDYGIYAYALGSSNRFMADPSLEGNETGFRLASPG